MANRHGGRRPGAGKPKGTKHAKTRAVEAAIRADQKLTAQATLEQIRRGACYDVRRLFDAEGKYRRITDLTEEEAAMIGGVEVVKRNLTAGDGRTDVILKIKLVDRAKYVEMAAKYHGLLTEHQHLHLAGDWERLAARLASARKRASFVPVNGKETSTTMR